MFDRVGIDPDELCDDRYNPSRMYEDQQVVQSVTDVFVLLRDVTLLHALDGHTLAEVAKRLEVKRSVVERAWTQARDILKEHL